MGNARLGAGPNMNDEAGFQRKTFLSRLPDHSREALAALWRTRTYEEGELIIGEGDTDKDLFFVLSGEVRAAVFTLTGKEVSFRDIGAGDCFGEIAAVDKQSRVSSVIARTKVDVARLSSTDCDQRLHTDPDFSTELLRLLAWKLRDLSARVVDYAELTVAQRVRRELLQLARTKRKGLDEALIPNPPNQSELATVIFARREAVAREMAALGRRGLIMREKNALRVPSIRRLEASVTQD